MEIVAKGLIVALACSGPVATASAAEMMADKPGLMCASAAALAQLTLPTGDSKTHRPGASPADIAAARQGGCVDIQPGLRVTVMQHRQNTSVVSYVGSSAASTTMIVPNKDFQYSESTGPQPAPTSQVLQAATASDTPASAPATNAGSTRASELFQSPKLTDIVASLAYGKMTGTTPDFRAYAEHSAPYQAASAFQKDSILQHLAAAYKAQYDAMSLSSIYSMQINTDLSQYDSTRGGYPLGFNDNAFIQMNDPTNYTGYKLSFININSYNFLPMPNAEAAQDFAAKYGFSTHYASAGTVILEIAFQLVDAPPAVDSQTTVIRAHIIAGQIRSNTGQILYAFPIDRADPANSARSDGTTMGPHVDTLKTALIQNIGIGTPIADALKTARSEYPKAATDETAAYDSYFNDLKGPARGSFCGGLGTITASPDAMIIGGGFSTNRPEMPGLFSSCLSFGVAGSAVTEVHSAQFESGTTREALVKALIEHYGPPTYKTNMQDTESDRWIGKDQNGQIVEIDGLVDPQGQVILLKVDTKLWKDPHPKQAPVPSTTGTKL